MSVAAWAQVALVVAALAVAAPLLGRYVLVPTPAVPVPFDRRVVAVALADQVAAAFAADGGPRIPERQENHG